jgi:hypothetical protein
MRFTLRWMMLVVLLWCVAFEGCGGGGFSGWQVVRGASDSVPNSGMKTIFVNCPAGKSVLGGGAVVGFQQGNNFPTDPNGILTESEPNGGNNGWQASAVDHTPGDQWAVIGYAICANVN